MEEGWSTLNIVVRLKYHNHLFLHGAVTSAS